MGTGVSPLVGLSRVTCSRVSVQEAGDTSSLPYARPGHSGRIATMEAGDLFTLLYRVPEIVTLGRFPGGGESDSRWRTKEVRHVGSDTLTPGF